MDVSFAQPVHHNIYMQNINTVIYKWPNATKYYEYDRPLFTFNYVFTPLSLADETSHMFLGVRILVEDTNERAATTHVRIYKEDHYTLLHTKYERSGPYGFGEEDFSKFFP